MRAKRIGRLILGLLVSAGFVVLILRQLDLKELGAVFEKASLGPLIYALLALAVDFFVRILRWWMMLRAIDVKVGLRECIWPFLVSISVNNVVPFRAGDLLRIVGFRETLKATPMARASTLLIERLLDLLVLLIFFFLGLVVVGSAAVPQEFILASFIMIIAAVSGLILLLLMPNKIHLLVDHILGCKLWSSQSLVSRLRGLAEQLFDSLAMLKSYSLILRLLIVSFIAWTLEGCVFLAAAWSLSGHIPYDGAWLALVSGTLATLIPSSPGYVGTFDYFVMKAVQAAGSEAESAAAFALLVHMLLWLPMTLAGALYFLFPSGRSLWAVARRSAEEV